MSVKDKFDTDIVIVTELSILNMNRIALGLPQTEDEVIIWERLLNKKDVIFLERRNGASCKSTCGSKSIVASSCES